MSKMFAGGIKTDKACVLIALDQMFPYGYEGRDFLLDMFVEHFQDTGFPSRYFYIIEESAPVQKLPEGRWNVQYEQGDMYVKITSHDRPMRYKVYAHTPVIYFYEIDSITAHAICITASLLPYFIEKTTYVELLLPLNIIRENIRYVEEN